MQTFDVIVVGVGGMGSATCWALAKRGVRALGIEQHDVGHALGSSHGQTRLIRQAYFEHPAYVPLLKSAYRLWDEMCAKSGRKLFHRNGLVIYGAPNGTILSGVRRSSVEHGIPVVEHDSAAAATLHAVFRAPEGFGAIEEPGGGYLEVEACVRAMTELARASGVAVSTNERIERIEETSHAVEVETDRGKYRAARIIVTAGPWSAQLVPEIAPKLSVRRVPLFWFKAQDAYRKERGVPCFGFEMSDGFYYGLPTLDERGVKVGLHVPGDVVAKPEEVDRAVRASDLEKVQQFLTRCLPGVDAKTMLHHAVCMYTMTPDENFIIDTRGRVSFAAGFSGHGYKFASVVGEVLADLTLDGGTAHPIDFLRWRW